MALQQLADLLLLLGAELGDRLGRAQQQPGGAGQGEQAEGGEIGTSSDIFSLGAVVAFAATGEGPFGGGSVASLLYRVVHSPASIDGVPDQIRPLVARCLDKDPGQRPTAGEILAELGLSDAEIERLADEGLF